MDRKMRSSAGLRQTRQGGPRSKRGCKNCRLRHIKCDESRPACTRCTIASLICGGYPHQLKDKHLLPALQPKGTSKNEPKSVAFTPDHECTSQLPFALSSSKSPFGRSLLNFSGTPKEHRSLHFFLHKTAVNIRYFSGDEFCGQFLRVAMVEKSILHALIAMASVHEDNLREMISEKPISKHFTFSQYNKAIKALNSRISNDKNSIQVTLLACVSFVYLELLGKSPHDALGHFSSGLRLLYSHNRDLPDSVGNTSNAVFDNNSELYQKLSRILGQQRMFALGQRPIPHELYDFRQKPGLGMHIDQPFSSISEAKEILKTFIANFIMPRYILPGSIFIRATPIEICSRKTMELRLDFWALQLVALKDSNISAKGLRDILMLQVHGLILTIWNTQIMNDSQISLDAQTDRFHSMMSLVEQLLTEDPSEIGTAENPFESLSWGNMHSSINESVETKPCHLSSHIKTKPLLIHQPKLEMDFLHPLYLTAIKCRSPTLRRRAISLLGASYPRYDEFWKQGKPWSAHFFKAVAQYVVAFEESHCSHEITEDASTWPSEAHRIQNIYILPVYGEDDLTQTALFAWQPDGPGTRVESWMKKFNL